MVLEVQELINSYQEKKNEIKKRLNQFKAVWNEDDKKIFAELCFCILTPQSKARNCLESITSLEKTGVLFTGDADEIKKYLKGVRFHNKKAEYIVKAREFFSSNGKIRIKDKISRDDVLKTRDFLVNNVKGISYKEGSHILRNIGLGDEIAILDRHILKNLKEYGVIEDNPSLSKKKYLEIEEKMKGFSSKIGIPMAELDLLFWSMETGEILK